MNLSLATHRKPEDIIIIGEGAAERINKNFDRLFADLGKIALDVAAYRINLSTDVTGALALASLAGIDATNTTSYLRRDGTWSVPPQPTGFIQQIGAVRPQWSIDTADGWIDVGWTTTSGGLITDVVDASGPWRRMSVTAVDGSNSFTRINSFGGVWADWNPTLMFRIRTGVITNVRFWLGLWSTNPTNNNDTGATTADKAVSFRYSTGASDAGWMPFKIDSGAVTVGTSVANIAASTVYSLRISISGNGTLATFGVTPLGGVEATQTLALTALTGTRLDFKAYIYSRGVAVKAIDMANVYQEVGCGVS